MPLIRVSASSECRRKWSTNCLEKLRAAIAATLGVPDSAFLITVSDMAETWLPPTPKTDGYVLFEISLYPGRSVETKVEAKHAICALATDFGVPSHSVFVLFNEIDPSNWFFPAA